MSSIKDQIIRALERAAKIRNPELEFPENETFGDYSTNVALKTGQKAGDIVTRLQKNKKLFDIVEKIDIAGPGFINFWLKKEVLLKNLEEIDKEKEKYGKSDINKGKRVMFEYGQPNTHKLPHIGHLFSYIYGESTTRLLEATGWEVRRVNYQGDVGLHVAKCLWAFQKDRPEEPDSLAQKASLLQKMYQKGSKAYEEDESAKKGIQELNKKIYDKDSSVFDLWQKTRGWSLDYYQEFEKRLEIKFDRYYFESEVEKKGKEKVLQNISKVFINSQGAVIFEGSIYGLHDRVFVTGEGNPTYEAKDLYLEELKLKEWPMDQLIITTANEQNAYFRVVFRALEEIHPEMKGILKHIGFGMINLKTGKMGSRTGNIISAIDLVDEVVAKVEKIDKKSSETVGIGAVKYSFLKNNPLQDVSFDIEKSVAAEGNSGPYLQYTVARTNSVLAKTRNSKPETLNKSKNQINNEELAILRKLSQFQEIIINAAKTYSPNILCNYLYDLASKFNTFYSKYRILGSENEGFRLALTGAAGSVLKNGLNLLGIEAPERM